MIQWLAWRLPFSWVRWGWEKFNIQRDVLCLFRGIPVRFTREAPIEGSVGIKIEDWIAASKGNYQSLDKRKPNNIGEGD